ncbi:AI-2E family transporter [Catenuloplanes japonicus]|uniref:AI-2E family transporter n=1 Tax=Catenuloplanes japonicus TaxID=33876 RepID=UPI000AC13BF4
MSEKTDVPELPEPEATEPPAEPEPERPVHVVNRADALAAFGAKKFGQPGRPLRRNPFLTGLLGGLGLALAYAMFLGIRNASSVLVLIFIALFLAVGLHPAVVALQRWHIPRGLAVALVVLGVVGLIGGGITALVPPVVTQVGGFVEQLPSYVEALQRSRTLRELIQQYDLVEKAQTLVSTENASRVFGGVFGGARLVFGTVFNVLTVLILTIYFLAGFERMKRAGYLLVPASRRERVQLIGDEILAKVGAYLVGALGVALLCGLSTFVFALAVDLPYPFALAIVVAICDLIPQIGATLGAVVVSLVGFATSLPVGIACIVFFILYQQLENYLIYPKVMRRSVEVSDVAAIVAALLGVSLFGVIGALVAIPAVAAVQIIIREVVIPRQATR